MDEDCDWHWSTSCFFCLFWACSGFLVLLNINLHAGIMHTCPTPYIHIHEHFKTSPEESLLPDTLPPLNGTNLWLGSYNTRICTNCYTPSPLTDQIWWQRITKKFAAASRKGMWTKWKPISAINITRIMETAEVPCMLQCGEPCRWLTQIDDLTDWTSAQKFQYLYLKIPAWSTCKFVVISACTGLVSTIIETMPACNQSKYLAFLSCSYMYMLMEAAFFALPITIIMDYWLYWRL